MLKFGLIGCGSVAPQHIKEINRIGQLTALCDTILLKAEKLAEGKIPVFGTLEEMLTQEMDAVVICTPNGMHAEHAIKSLQSGKHVVCESPFCLTAAGAWQVIETEKYCGKTLVPLLWHRQVKEVIALHKEILAGNKPQSFHVQCQFVPADTKTWETTVFPGGGPLYTKMAAMLDVVSWLFGSIELSKGFTIPLAKNADEIEDGGAVSLLMENGIIGQINWQCVNDHPQNKISIRWANEEQDIDLLQIMQKSERAYTDFYTNLIAQLQDKNEVHKPIYEAMKTVTNIEKIYKAINTTA